MKLFFLFAALIIILLSVNPVDNSESTQKKETNPACCSKGECNSEENTNAPDDLFPLQFNPIHI